MKNKLKGLLFRAPGILLLLIAVIGAFYVKIKNLMETPIRWITPVTILLIFVLYVLGEYISTKEDSPMY